VAVINTLTGSNQWDTASSQWDTVRFDGKGRCGVAQASGNEFLQIFFLERERV
jgi:hypothetical protein